MEEKKSNPLLFILVELGVIVLVVSIIIGVLLFFRVISLPNFVKNFINPQNKTGEHSVINSSDDLSQSQKKPIKNICPFESSSCFEGEVISGTSYSTNFRGVGYKDIPVGSAVVAVIDGELDSTMQEVVIDGKSHNVVTLVLTSPKEDMRVYYSYIGSVGSKEANTKEVVSQGEILGKTDSLYPIFYDTYTMSFAVTNMQNDPLQFEIAEDNTITYERK